MAFDWISFFSSYRIPYRDQGANTSAGNVVVHCPFCGPQDPSEHMSIDISGKGWRCFRNHDHRGKNPARLVAGLAKVNMDRANALVGNAVFIPDDFLDRVRGLTAPPEIKQSQPKGLDMPPEFRRFEGLPSSEPYVGYLRRRGYTGKQIEKMSRLYGLRYCTRGAYHHRVIFPVKFQGRLVSWTGRSIAADAELRYKALSRDPERAANEGYDAALGAISHYVLWYDWLRKADADTLVLCEGPFDALKICVLGRRAGVVATCFFTAQPTQQQMFMLDDLLPRYKKRVVILDQAGTFATGIRITNALSSLGVTTYTLPRNVKDPGLFDISTFDDFLFAMR